MRRRTTVIAIVLCLVVVAAGCEEFKDSVPEGKAPLRYRDALFTKVDTTTDVVYGSAPAFDGSGPVTTGTPSKTGGGDGANSVMGGSISRVRDVDLDVRDIFRLRASAMGERARRR